jgi:hypothetical protein
MTVCLSTTNPIQSKASIQPHSLGRDSVGRSRSSSLSHPPTALPAPISPSIGEASWTAAAAAVGGGVMVWVPSATGRPMLDLMMKS